MSKKRYNESHYNNNNNLCKKQKIEQVPELNEIRKILTFLIQNTVNDNHLIQTCVKKINQLEQHINHIQLENNKYQVQLSNIHGYANIHISNFKIQPPSYIS
jgi:hypothetical protein